VIISLSKCIIALNSAQAEAVQDHSADQGQRKETQLEPKKKSYGKPGEAKGF